MDCSESDSRGPLVEVTFINLCFTCPQITIKFTCTDACSASTFHVLHTFHCHCDSFPVTPKWKRLKQIMQKPFLLSTGASFLYFTLINIFSSNTYLSMCFKTGHYMKLKSRAVLWQASFSLGVNYSFLHALQRSEVNQVYGWIYKFLFKIFFQKWCQQVAVIDWMFLSPPPFICWNPNP